MAAKLQTYQKKDIAIEALNKYNAAVTACKNKQRLYAFDVNDKGAKCFLTETRKTMAEYVRLENSSYYEYIMADDQVKLFFDIDIKNENLQHAPNKLTVCIDKCVREYNAVIAKYAKVQPKCIVLTASVPTKLSAHIIYTNIHFKSIQIMKGFIAEIEKPVRELMHIDSIVYRIGCFRCIWSSKKGKNNRLVYSHCYGFTPSADYSKSYEVYYDSQLTWIKKNSTLIEYEVPEKTYTAQKIIKVNKKKKEVNVNFCDKLILKTSNICGSVAQYKLVKQLVACLKVSRADNFFNWIKIGLCLKGIESSERYFIIFDEFSKQSDKYLSIVDSIRTWNGLSLNQDYCSIGVLRVMAKKDNPEKYFKLNHVIEPDKILFKTIQFSSNFVFNMHVSIKKQTECNVVCEHVDKWLNSNIKTLALKSAYGTGKTELLKAIFGQNFKNPKRVLIITHRMSLALEFSSIFKNFFLYIDGMYDESHFICQVESLHHIKNLAYLSSKKIEYDLIVIDEVVSVLRHFDSSTVTNPEGVYEHLQELISDAKKLIVCDGDFDNSSFEFINQFGPSVILENTIKKSYKCLEFIKFKKVFEKKLEKDLRNKKNIYLVCMSSKTALKYANKYKEYDPVVYYGDMDENTRLKLKDVNSEWRKKQLVIVTPVVESGISFNGPHFYKQYVVLSEKSTSPRALMQMMSRVRQFEVDDVPVYINKLPFSCKECSTNFNDARNYVLGVKERFKNKVTLTECNKMLIYNVMETINKNRNNFIAVLISLCKCKGYDWKLNDKNLKKEDNVKEDNINFDIDFTNVKLIDTDTATELKKLICLKGCSKERKLEVMLHDFAISWKLDLLNLKQYKVNRSYEGRDEIVRVVEEQVSQFVEKVDKKVYNNESVSDKDATNDNDLMLCFSDDEEAINNKNEKTSVYINKVANNEPIDGNEVVSCVNVDDYDHDDENSCDFDYDNDEDNKFIPDGSDHISRYISTDLVIDKVFATVWYKKTYVLYNLRDLLGKTNKYSGMDGDNFRKEVQYTRILLIRKLIKDLGFVDLVNNIAIGQEIIIGDEEMRSKVNKIVYGDIFMRNDIDILFNKVPGTFQRVVDKYLASNKVGYLIRFINDHMLCDYGCIVNRKKVGKSVNKTWVTTCCFELCFIDEFINHI